MALTYREWLKVNPDGNGMQYQAYLTGLAQAARQENESSVERLDTVVELLNDNGTGWDVLSSSDDLTQVTLFDGKFYLDITITEWEEGA